MDIALKGECLCGTVEYEVDNTFSAFYQCHCKQCQQLTGTAFSSNIFTAPHNIAWISGKNDVTNYIHPDRDFSKSFCRLCGSAVPHVNKSGLSLVIPAGSLTEAPNILPQGNVFTSDEASWLKKGLEAKRFSGFPE